MLVLSLKLNERLVLTTRHGEHIEVCLVDTGGDKARIGVEAPLHVSVHRMKVWLAIQREKRAT